MTLNRKGAKFYFTYLKRGCPYFS